MVLDDPGTEGKKSQKVTERGPKVEEKGPKVGEKGLKVTLNQRKGAIGLRDGREESSGPVMRLTRSAARRCEERMSIEDVPSQEEHTCAFVRTVRRFLEYKLSIYRQLTTQKCEYEIAEIGGTVRAPTEGRPWRGQIPSGISFGLRP